MSQSRNYEHIFKPILEKIFSIYNNENLDVDTGVNERGLAAAFNTLEAFRRMDQGILVKINNTTDESIQAYLDALDTTPIQVNLENFEFKYHIPIKIDNQMVDCEIDLTRAYGALISYGLTEEELKDVSNKEIILITACFFAIGSYYFTQMDIAEIANRELLEDENQQVNEQSVDDDETEYEKQARIQKRIKTSFENYLTENFTKVILGDFMPKAIKGVEIYLERYSKELAIDKKPGLDSAVFYYTRLQEKNKTRLHRELLLLAILVNANNETLRNDIAASAGVSVDELTKTTIAAIAARIEHAARKNDGKKNTLMVEFNELMNSLGQNQIRRDEILEKITAFENKLPYEDKISVHEQYTSRLDQQAEIEQIRVRTVNDTGSQDHNISRDEFLYGLRYLTKNPAISSYSLNRQSLLRTTMSYDQGKEISFLDKMNIDKNDNNAYIMYFAHSSFDEGKRNILAENIQAHTNIIEIVNKNGAPAQLQLPSLLAMDIVETLKLIEPGYHSGLSEIRKMCDEISRDSEQGIWSPEKFEQIIKQCEYRTDSVISFFSHFSLFGYIGHARDPGVDLLYRAIVEMKENIAMFPEIKRLDQLMIAQQKRDHIKLFNEEIKRLEPAAVPAAPTAESSDFKIDAYKTGKRVLEKSGVDEVSGEILQGDIPVENNRRISYRVGGVENEGNVLTVKDALRTRRAEYAPKSEIVWNKVTRDVNPRETLEKLIPENLRPVRNV